VRLLDRGKLPDSPARALYTGVRLGSRVEIHSGAVIGADGSAMPSEKGSIEISQAGIVEIGDDVEIGRTHD